MTVSLTPQQREAITAYEALMARHPQLFAARELRPVVRDLGVLEAYAAEHGTVLGVAAETPYVLFVIDLVESRQEGRGLRRHPYLRVISRAQLEGGVNVVVLATLQDATLGRVGDIVLVEQERHAPGTRETELPRGFGEPGQSGEANALRELREETGYIGEQAHYLGSICTDSGLTDCVVAIYHVPVTQRCESTPETEEAISRVRVLSGEDIWKGIQRGTIRDAFTLQALALYERQQLPR